jgi:TRAP-type mannitol/chloroaromatic compound transport system permease small subunit
MQAYVNFVDRLSVWIGRAFAWCIMVMTLGVSYEVFVRYVLRNPTSWSFDVTYMMYGSLFMMAGAYTLSRDGHVRGDFLYRLWRPRTQAAVELTLYILFFFPGTLALTFAGADYAAYSWRFREVSVMSPANVPIFQFKTLLPAAGALLVLQGTAQVCRCLLCLRTGSWPPLPQDVEETESMTRHEREDEAELTRRLGAEQGDDGTGGSARR